MVDVVSHWVLRSLHADQILVFAGTSGHGQPVVAVIALVFVALAEIPTKNKVLGNVVDGRANETHCYVMPWHATKLGLGELVGLPVFHRLEVHNAVVVEVLPGEDLILHTSRVGIRQGVLP